MHNKQEALLKHVIRSPNDDPLRETMLLNSSPLPVVTENRRVGRPKCLWTDVVYKRIWNKTNLGGNFSYDENPKACIMKLAPPMTQRIIRPQWCGGLAFFPCCIVRAPCSFYQDDTFAVYIHVYIGAQGHTMAVEALTGCGLLASVF